MKIYLLCEYYEEDKDTYNPVFCSHNKKLIDENFEHFDSNKSPYDNYFTMEYKLTKAEKVLFKKWLKYHKKFEEKNLYVKKQLFIDLDISKKEPFVKAIYFNDDQVLWDNINMGGYDANTYPIVEFLYE